jgi:hypothetical protein
MLQHMQEPVRPPLELKPEFHIPETLSRVILKAMEKSREQRFQTAEELIAALDQVETVTVPQVTTPKAELGNSVAALLFSEMAAQPLPPLSIAAPLEPASGRIVQSNPSVDSPVINSAAQHVFLPPRSLPKLLVRVMAVVVASVLVIGAGYLSYKSVRRVGIERAVTRQLMTAPSATLRSAAIGVSVSGDREVTLDGSVSGAADSAMAEQLVSSVPGVVHVNNRLIVAPVVPVESSQSLINRGMTFMDSGDYASAIACFRKALADPNNKGAKELLDRAQRAQQTEEELLKNRQ